MNRLRNRLILFFLAATLAPLGVTLWMTTSLLEHNVKLASSAESQLDAVSRSLESTAREFYQRARMALQHDASEGRISPEKYLAADSAKWPDDVKEFWESGEKDGFALAGKDGDRLLFLVRKGPDVWSYPASLGTVALDRIAGEYRAARESVDLWNGRDLRKGFTYTYIITAAVIWIASLAVLVWLANRISKPIQELTAGLSQLAGGTPGVRVPTTRDDEIGRAVRAFNHMAEQLQHSRNRLVYLTQLASWQSLARKMAHELKNSLTPIRLTVEEMLVRHGENDSAFMAQAAQIVVDEVESLERRIRAFSEFAAEPPVRLADLRVNTLLEERIAFLKTGHPEVSYALRLASGDPQANADEELIKGVLTNLLENAAEAAGAGGRILAAVSEGANGIAIEIHDSGPGLSDLAKRSLFQPTISFKKRGMGLGLSIARKSALLVGGDIELVPSELGGAGFRVVLAGPAADQGVRPTI
ncbi:MAG: ATP-binding protein [Bryobacteraceae bacterium]